VIGSFLIGCLISLAVGPRTPTLGTPSSGDVALINDVRSVLVSNRGYQTLSVGRIRNGQASFAGLGAQDGAVPTPQTRFEMGSITKTMTGLLLADAVERGEMRLDDRLATHLPELAGTPAGGVTLEQLATHRSGLPSLPRGIVLGGLGAQLGNDNPYAVSVATVIEAAKTAEVRTAGQYAYSNLGVSLLGHAEARAAGLPDWPTLARERLIKPLGLSRTTFALTAAEIPAEATPGHKDNGWRAPYWYGPGFAPAGSTTWTTAEDLTRFAQAVLNGQAPGMAAVKPRATASKGEIGLTWQISEVDGRAITWHNGGTGGMRSMLALDIERGQAAVILGNTTRWVDRAGLTLAASDQTMPAVDRPAGPGLPALAATVAGLMFLLIMATTAARAHDRLAVAGGLLCGAAGLLILLAHGPWSLVPAWPWGGLLGVGTVLAVYTVARARQLPGQPERRRIRGWLSAAQYVIVLAWVIWTL
jgi:CubicO group peptidase (beta-lactamase class C family)